MGCLARPWPSTCRGYLKEEIGSLQKTVHELSSRLESANDPTVRDRLREAKDRLGAASQEGDLVDIVRRSDGRLREYHPKLNAVRWKQISIVFQVAMNALNQVYTFGNQLCEAIR